MHKTHSIGKTGEEIATQYFIKKGYKLLDKNFRTKNGEIDLIFEKDNTVIFVEVKFRTQDKFGDPIESITSKKISKIIETAKFYVNQYELWDKDIRFDVITIKEKNGKYKFDHVREAFIEFQAGR